MPPYKQINRKPRLFIKFKFTEQWIKCQTFRVIFLNISDTQIQLQWGRRRDTKEINILVIKNLYIKLVAFPRIPTTIIIIEKLLSNDSPQTINMIHKNAQ